MYWTRKDVRLPCNGNASGFFIWLFDVVNDAKATDLREEPCLCSYLLLPEPLIRIVETGLRFFDSSRLIQSRESNSLPQVSSKLQPFSCLFNDIAWPLSGAACHAVTKS